MECPSLEMLVLTEEELLEARRQVREMAYYKWQQAGCPEDADGLRYWKEAEREWIEYYYVPHRDCGRN